MPGNDEARSSAKTTGPKAQKTLQPNSSRSGQFSGSDNPRHLRAIRALLVSPQPREVMDSRAGCSNFPDLVQELRRRGLEIPCQRTPCFDRDGNEVQRGIYCLTDADRRRIRVWMTSTSKGGAQ